MKKPIIAITMGDPGGIGPEIIIKALSKEYIYDICKPIVVGDGNILQTVSKLTGYNTKFNIIDNMQNAEFDYKTIDVYHVGNIDTDIFTPGRVSAESGESSYRYIEKAINLAMEKKVDATVTAPINKEALNLTKHAYSGHTEIYAALTKTKDYAMMLIHNNLRVIHVSTHVSLKQAINLVKKDRIIEKIILADKTLKQLGLQNPKIAVAGLNPHCGENGLFGYEEIDEIIPAIDESKKLNINAIGPIPADTVFSKAQGGLYDAVIAMYHDQGHIPLKVLGFKWDETLKKWDSVSGVNITLGLPIIRCSVDHGTAYDIAWRGIASEDSIIGALEYAVKLSVRRGKNDRK